MSNGHETSIQQYHARLAKVGVPPKVRQRMAWDELHPAVVAGFLLTANRILDAFEAGNLTQVYLPFEGYRAPAMQLEMVKRNVSKAGPWSSAHNYGLAVDFVGWNKDELWNWQPADSADWKEIGVIATNAGMLRPITWDKPHVEHPLWHSVKKLLIRQ